MQQFIDQMKALTNSNQYWFNIGVVKKTIFCKGGKQSYIFVF